MPAHRKARRLVLAGIVVAIMVMVILLVEPTPVDAAEYRMMLTTDPHYDRNPSVLEASNGTWWLFFTHGRNETGVRGVGVGGYNPDLDYYDIYYKTAESPQTLQGAPEYKIPITPPDNAQRDVAALQASDGKIWVFASTGLGPGLERSIYYYLYDGASWSGPTPIEGTDYAAHIDALESGGNIWVFYDIGYSLYALQLGASPTLVTSNATIGKAIYDDGRFYVVWSHVNGLDVWGDYIGLSTSSDGTTWTNYGGIASWSGLTNWDPVLFEHRGLFRLFWAPSNSEQFIATSQTTNPSDPGSWSAPIRLTTASYDSETWWDFWPEVAQDETGAMILFYTSESSADGTRRIDANIWMVGLAPSVADLAGFTGLPTGDVLMVIGDLTNNPHGSKPTGVNYQIGRDMTPLGYIRGMMNNTQPSIFDTNAAVNATSGRPLSSIPQKLIFSVGGPGINAVSYYYETTSNASDRAPIMFSMNATHYIWTNRTDGEVLAVLRSSCSVPPGTTDVFVIQVLRDADGRLVALMYGTHYTGTWAAAEYFKFIVYPTIASWTGSYYIVQWTDATSGTSANLLPDSGDTFTILAQGG